MAPPLVAAVLPLNVASVITFVDTDPIIMAPPAPPSPAPWALFPINVALFMTKSENEPIAPPPSTVTPVVELFTNAVPSISNLYPLFFNVAR